MTFATAAPPLSVTNGGGLNGSDQLIVRYYGSSAVGGGADSGVLDCVGNAVAANVLSANRYFVALDTGTGEPALQCEASSAPGAPVVLVNGVESLQLLYGEDTDGDGVVDKDGYAARLLFRTTTNPIRQVTQEIVKRNLEEIGIGVELKAITPTVFFSGDPDNPDAVNKFYTDLQMYTTTPDSPDPTYFFTDYTCPEVAAAANQWQSANYSRYCNPEYDALYSEFAQEFDPARRTELAIQLNDFLVQTDYAVIPLINRFTPSGKAKNLEGPTFSNFDSVLWNIDQWKRTN